MFTLKLYQNGQGMPGSRMVVMEVAGIWVDICDGSVKSVLAFKKKVGVQDEEGPYEFYVGGTPTDAQLGKPRNPEAPVPAITTGIGGNYYSWGVLENAQGKTTEMIR